MYEILQSIQSSRPWEAFWRGEQPAFLVRPDGTVQSEMPRGSAILPGSFNPLHEGHRKMAEAASQILSTDVLFELSVANVDKSTIEPAEVLRRIEQFIGYRSIAITRADTFLVKASLFSGCRFVVGYDTAERIISPRYYSNEAAMCTALETIAAAGCLFLVACRVMKGELKCLEDLDIPSEIAPLFKPIPVDLFRFDVSSTELRKRE